MRELRTAVLAVIAITAVLGVAYPLAMTGAGQLAFGGRADGSLVTRDGKVVGSRLIGQDFKGAARYFQSRPSVTKYSGNATFFNNQGPNQKALAGMLEANAAVYLEREGPFNRGLTAAGIPADAVTTSASGVDPHISRENAVIQAGRVAKARGVERERVLALADRYSSRPLLGLGGPGSVNVLELNLALDREAAR
jgi:K+-transporting ATPase ATPase C chain